MPFQLQQLIVPQLAPNSDTALFTVPTGWSVRIDAMTVTNNDTSARTITVWLVPAGDTAGTDNVVVNAQSVLAGKSLQLAACVGQVLGAGDSIHVQASVASQVMIMASGQVQY